MALTIGHVSPGGHRMPAVGGPLPTAAVGPPWRPLAGSLPQRGDINQLQFARYCAQSHHGSSLPGGVGGGGGGGGGMAAWAPPPDPPHPPHPPADPIQKIFPRQKNHIIKGP